MRSVSLRPALLDCITSSGLCVFKGIHSCVIIINVNVATVCVQNSSVHSLEGSFAAQSSADSEVRKTLFAAREPV